MDISTDCCTCWPQCVCGLSLLSAVVSHTHRPSSEWLHSTDTHQDKTHCTSSSGCSNSIPGRNPDTCCTCCVTKVHWELSACSRTQKKKCVCFWQGYHLHHNTAKYGYSGVMKESTGAWNGTLLSSLKRVGSVFMRVMDMYMYSINLVSIIFQSAFSYDAQVPP